jgi:hypothetical protein
MTVQRRRAAPVAAAVGAMLAAVAAPAGGADIEIDAVGACPDAAAVSRLLVELVSEDEARAAPIVIQDRGRHFRVAVGDAATTIDDPARDCGARAREAAIVAANQLHAPRVVLGPPTWTVEKGVVIEIAPGAGGEVPRAYGAEIRGAFGSKRWSLVGAAGARTPVEMTFPGGWKAELIRFPLDAGMRLTSYRWRLRPWLVLGGSATVTGILGQDLVETDREWRLGLGALAMVGGTLRVTGRLGVAAALALRWEPRAYRLRVVPVGQVGETPEWWFGVSFNYVLDGKGSSPP